MSARLPDSLHKLKGSRPTRAASDKPDLVTPPGRPRYPKDLTEYGRRVFKELCKLLEKRRALTEGDSELIRLYAIAKERHKLSNAKIVEQGVICSYTRLDSNGRAFEIEKENLHYKIVVKCEQQMVAILDRLGLTPNARSKVQPTAQEKPKVKTVQELENEKFASIVDTRDKWASNPASGAN